MVTLGVSHTRNLLATACKATTLEHAVVRVYDTRSYKLVGEPLQGHILTVTRICFSPNDRYILTVSRDRTWRLFEVRSENGKYAVILLSLCSQCLKYLIQVIFQLLPKRLMPASSGIAGGPLKEIFSQQHHGTRRYLTIRGIPLPISYYHV